MKTKTASKISGARAAYEKRFRFNPIRGLDPQGLGRALDEFECGYLDRAARIWEYIERRDDMALAVASKRKKRVARLGWSIVAQGGDAAKSARHAAFLENFYNNLRATSAIDGNKVGGVALMIRQMLDAVSKGYAVHEVLFNGSDAVVQFVPLWFFENTVGKLRFLKGAAQTSGEDLEEGGWMVTAGDFPLMESTSIAYMIKRDPLFDWANFCRRFGSGFPKGKTAAPRGSDAWKDFENILANASNMDGILTGKDDDFSIEQPTAAGIPFSQLVDRMDRAIARIWCGSDLSTISAANGAGASLQGSEAADLEDDDCRLVEESLEHQLSRFAIMREFGDCAPAAYFSLERTDRSDIDKFQERAAKSAAAGCPMSRADYYEGTRTRKPDPSEDVVQASAASADFAASPSFNKRTAANADGTETLLQKRAIALSDVRKDLETAHRAANAGEYYAALSRLKKSLPQIMRSAPEYAKQINDILKGDLK